MNNYSLLNHNTFGMDVYAKRFFEYNSVEELKRIIEDIPADEQILLIGEGSNLLFKGNYNGSILHSKIKGIDIIEESENEVLVRVGSGKNWDEFVEYCVKKGWGGAENLSLIPGEVGASAVQNIGAYGVEAKDIIILVEAVEIRNGQSRVFGNAECNYEYRQSIFKKELKGCYAITYVTYKLSKHPSLKLDYGNIRSILNEKKEITIEDVRNAIINIRNSKLPDPKILGNAGSFFMNPIVSKEKFLSIQKKYPNMPFYDTPNGIKIPAGWMIDQCGWKGKSIGKAAVHDKQALVLVNLGGATSDEIITLSNAICESVQKQFGVSIHPEVNFI
ncbi:MAG: UDP-N-acetylmuramate dehydrogenase [Bacteroidaceae bacterium]|nr:UDP-N-acetylmuramate dehydrogenase [Bacteroidaceae bacterium]